MYREREYLGAMYNETYLVGTIGSKQHIILSLILSGIQRDRESVTETERERERERERARGRVCVRKRK